MIGKKSRSTSKTKTGKASRQKASRKPVATAPKKAARAIRQRAATATPLEFMRTEPSVTVYEVIETEVYGKSNDQDGFGT